MKVNYIYEKKTKEVKKFDYNYYLTLIDKLRELYGKNNSVDTLLQQDAVPLQMELQMGLTCGGYKCKFCYGKHTQKEDIQSPIDTETYYKLIDDVKGKVSSIAFAGINTDPLGNHNFLKVVKKIKDDTEIKIGVHTKGLMLTDRVIQELNRNTSYGDFITFSVDSVNKENYNSLHGLPENSNFMDRTIRNIKALYDHKREVGSELNVNISALLFKDNCSYDEMKDLIETFKDHSDRIRFTFPQIPNLYKELPDYYIRDKRQVYSDVEKLQQEYNNLEITLLKFDTDKHEYTFDKCHAQRYLFVVNPSGNVFPCPQVTSPEFYHISYGNIKDNSFEEIWNGPKRKKVLDMKVRDMNCGICDRKDECINYEVDKRWKNN